MKQHSCYKRAQTFWLTALRIVIGWHFLYEGLVKLVNPNWTAYAYLLDSKGCFSSIFNDLANNSTALSAINYINIYGLIFVGLGLLLGIFSKYASIGGIIFLVTYYISHPPFVGAGYMMPTEGSYLWIDKNIIEICALMIVIYFPTSHIIGFDRLISKNKTCCNKTK